MVTVKAGLHHLPAVEMSISEGAVVIYGHISTESLLLFQPFKMCLSAVLSDILHVHIYFLIHRSVFVKIK